MATVQEMLDAVTSADTRIDSIIAYNDGLKAQLADALSGVTLPANVQAAVDAVFTKANAGAGKIDVALNTNVPEPPTT